MLASKADRYIADIRNNLLAYAFASTFRKHPGKYGNWNIRS
jgi:hypothetical protein